jgi:Leucine-rich repeat (LRR) protein
MPEFVDMTNLAKLTLTSNNINKWKANGTAGMPQLKQLILSKNKLTELKYDMFHKNNTIKIL